MSEEAQVRELLVRAADDLSPGALTPDHLLAAGERAVRRRRRLAVGAAAAVTAVALLGATALLGVRPAAPPADRGGPPTASPTAGPPTEAPRTLDPAQRLFRLGWQPEGLPEETFGGGATSQGIQLTDPSAHRMLNVKVGVRGQDRSRFLVVWDGRTSVPVPEQGAPGTPVDPVRGRKAWLYTSRDGRDVTLSWEYAPDAWAVLWAQNLERPAEVLRRVAEGLVWEPERVTVPVAPIRIPAGVGLYSVAVSVRDGRWQWAQLSYHPGPAEREDPDGVTVEVSREEPGVRGTRVTVAGRPAWVVDESPHSMGVYQVARLADSCSPCFAEVRVISAGGLALLGGRDAALAFAASIRLVPEPDTPGGWRPL
ncbi:hypothetical protein [Micromonospora sp. DT47]|uniref:hypothetical protein n=1 Tax=Micromonospora sp. DT47 TaxID=3393431 RepID=UPI003CF6F25B